MSDIQAGRFVSRGRVLGVGFRWWTVREARRQGVVGTVRNRADGSVEVEATGSSEALALFAGALHRGPPSARVEEVVRESSVPSEADDFVILR